MADKPKDTIKTNDELEGEDEEETVGEGEEELGEGQEDEILEIKPAPQVTTWLTEAEEEEEEEEGEAEPDFQDEQEQERPAPATEYSSAFEEPGEQELEEAQRVTVTDLDEMIRLLSDSNTKTTEQVGECEPEEVQQEEEWNPPPPAPSAHPSGTLIEYTGERDEEEGEGKEEKDGEQDGFMVLGPNHPKMQRFQKVLQEHLEKQLYNAQVEARDLEKQLRDTKNERQQTGSLLYNLQYELARQTDLLNKTESKIDSVVEEKHALEQKTSLQKMELDELQLNLKEEMKREDSLIRSMREIDVLEYCVRQAVDDFEHERRAKENMHYKIADLREKAEIRKRDQDYHLDKISGHVERMEQANAGIRRQIQAHQEEQKELQVLISEASTEIEAIQIEKKHLQRAWKETLSVIRGRDEALMAARASLRQAKENVRNRESELRFLKRAIVKEQIQHEQASILLKRRELENRRLALQVQKLTGHVENLEAQLQMLQNIRAEMEQEYLRANNEYLHKQRLLAKPKRKFDQLCAQKRDLEDKILAHLREKMAMDKMALNLAKRVEKARGETRTLEYQVVRVENEFTALLASVEKLRSDVLKKTAAVEEMEKKMAGQESALQQQLNELKISEKHIAKKTLELERMNQKLHKIIASRGGTDTETGPIEMEIDEIEKQIAISRTQCVEMQEDWLNLQEKVVKLTNEREAIAHENELIQKESYIIDRKKLRLEKELHIKEEGMRKLQREIDLFNEEITRINQKLSQNERDALKLTDDNQTLQLELVQQLQEAEEEVAELEAEGENLKREQEATEQALREAYEQCLAWEKKCKLMREVQKNIKFEEEHTNREIKLQIHHMKVRFSELQRVQEKLMSDLEGTVRKRDTILQKSEHELMKANLNPQRTRLNARTNLKRLNGTTRRMVNEVNHSEIEGETLKKRIEELNRKLECEAEALKNLKELIEQDEQKLMDAAISKHKYSIEISLRQKKYKILEAIRLCQFKPSWKGVENIQQHIAELETRCIAIAELCDLLLTQFPEHELQIKMIKASIYSHVN